MHLPREFQMHTHSSPHATLQGLDTRRLSHHRPSRALGSSPGLFQPPRITSKRRSVSLVCPMSILFLSEESLTYPLFSEFLQGSAEPLENWSCIYWSWKRLWEGPGFNLVEFAMPRGHPRGGREGSEMCATQESSASR